MVSLTVGQLYDRAVLQGGDRVAVTDGAKSVTYRKLGDDALQAAKALQSLGLGPGDRIAFLMSNCADYVSCEYAVAKTGATRVPLAVLLADDDHVYMMNFARCSVLVYHAKFSERVSALAPRLETVRLFIRIGDGVPLPQGHLSLAELIAHNTPDPREVDVDPEEIASIYFTGGTTGRPKGVMLSHRAWFQTYQTETLDFDIRWREVFVFVTPMTHAAGCLLLPVLLRQGRCVVLERFEPESLLSTIQSEEATATLLVPTMLYMLLDHPRRDEFDVRTLRNVLYGASAIAPERLRQAIEVYGARFTQFFGQTEAPMALTALPIAAHVVDGRPAGEEVLASAGYPTYSTSLRLVDEDGNDVAPGEPGELIARASNMMSGYLDDSAATATAIHNGWLYTGDIARRGSDGLITIVDRKKDVIISGGFNVYPRDVEDTLFEHPAVRQAAVVGVPHEKWGEQIRALVVQHEGASVTEAELIDFVRARKGSLMAPKAIDFTETLPMTNLGKIDRKAIRAIYWSGRSRNV